VPRRPIGMMERDSSAGTPPGPPIIHGDYINNYTAQAGFAYFGSGGMEEKSLYYYHSDHLGSTSYVTDRDGKVSQFVAYLPFGESLYEQHSNTKDMPYLFNGKERDEETGLYYYGARYYDPWSAVWAGVDPMWAEKIWLTPYHYCSNNPINRVDPTGMSDFDDIVITGTNNSSLTIKTDIIDINFSAPVDFGGNHTIADVSNVAIGYEAGVNATGAAGVGTSYNASVASVLFLGGDYAGYWYDYAGGEAQMNGTTSAEGSVGVHMNWFVAINHDKSKNNPKDFAGMYYGAQGSASFKAIGGINFNGQYSTNKEGSWSTYSAGVSATIGAQVGAFMGFSASGGGHIGSYKLIGSQVPTKDRSMFSVGANWFTHLAPFF